MGRRWCARWAWYLFLVVGACHPPPPPIPRTGPQVQEQAVRGSLGGAFIVTGRLIAKFPPAADGEVHGVLVTRDGSYRVWIRTLTGGHPLVQGDSITAWCRRLPTEAGETIADSVRVEHGP